MDTEVARAVGGREAGLVVNGTRGREDRGYRDEEPQIAQMSTDQGSEPAKAGLV